MKIDCQKNIFYPLEIPLEIVRFNNQIEQNKKHRMP